MQFWANGVERFRINPNGSTRNIPLSSAPASPAEGEEYYDSVLKKKRIWTGAVWESLN
jgi:hypothetical protein